MVNYVYVGEFHDANGMAELGIFSSMKKAKSIIQDAYPTLLIWDTFGPTAGAFVPDGQVIINPVELDRMIKP